MIFAGTSTGATGLEPATSGVTGLFQVYDDWRRWTRYRSIHAGLLALATDLRMIALSRFQASAALLLPRCLMLVAARYERPRTPSTGLSGNDWPMADVSGESTLAQPTGHF
jgi:uncharacterized membrane protein YdfJ with MMPL/SSD domain